MTFAGLESQEAGLLVASHLLAAFVSALLAVYVGWAHRERALGRVFALLLGALTVWTLGSAAKLFSPDPGTYVALSVVQYVGITLATALLFLFALLYDGRDRWVTRRVVAAVLVVPVLTLLVLATTRHHELFYTAIVEVPLGGTTVQTSRVGPLFWAWTGYGWALLLVGSALVVNAGFKRSAFYRVQSSLVILGVGVSWAVNAAFIAFGCPTRPSIRPRSASR